MTREEREQAIAILENEKKCVNRANKNDYCNRDCYNCELVKTDTEILTALDMAIKVLQEQADNIPVMYYPQVDGITPTVVAQADGENTCGTCRNEGTYHCAECENKSDYEQSQADGEYISKEKAIIQLSWDLSEVELPRIKESLDKLSSVAIPSEHDGCKDCKYETYPEYYYPCCECKHNYNDFWKIKPHWKPYLEEGLTVQCSECGSRFEIATKFCPRCGVYNGEEIER